MEKTLRVSVACHDEVRGEHHWIEHLWDAVSVKSVFPGHIRFHLGFSADETLSDALRRELQRLPSVRLESYSVRTRNVLVTFDPVQTTDEQVTVALLKGIREFARVHGECDLEHHHHGVSRHGKATDVSSDCGHDHVHAVTEASIRQDLLKLGLTGLLLLLFLTRKLRGATRIVPGADWIDIAALVTILAGYPILRSGIESVQKSGKATDDTLISIAVLATLLMGESVTGLSVVFLINLGRLLESVSLKRARTAIKELMDITPVEAWRINSDGKISKVSAEEISKGDRLRVFHDEKVPLDGKVIQGTASVREAFITGEAIPKEKRVGDSVYAGSLVESGDIDIEVTNLVHDTVVARMVEAIENAQETRPAIEKVGDRFASRFVPVSITVALLTLLFTGDLRRAVTMLVIACPCAAGLATPTAVSAAIGQAARRGILIKGGTHLEHGATVNTVVFDKTGTLTSGVPRLTKFIRPNVPIIRDESECLRLAASAERHSTHPLGIALVREAESKKIALLSVQQFKTFPGLGIESTVDGTSVHVGNRKFMDSLGLKIDQEVEEKSAENFRPGESVLYLAVNRRFEGSFIVEDVIRPEAPELLERLRKLGIRRIVLASGDQRIATEHIARQLGIEEFYSELLPQGKVDLLARLKAESAVIAMVGDGVNDAQALSHADLSIAMGSGHCDIAIETADVTLAKSDLLLVAETLKISKRTIRTIRQNFVASVGINSGGLLFGATGKLTPFAAAIVHNASTIAVVLNSLRLGREVAGASPLGVLKEVRI